MTVASFVERRRSADRRLDVQHRVARVLAEAGDLREAAGRVLAAVGGALDWQAGALWELDASGKSLACVEFWKARDARLNGFEAHTRRAPLSIMGGLPGLVWSSGEAAWVSDVAAARDHGRLARAAKSGLRGAFCAPIRIGGRVFGVMEFFSRRPRHPDEGLLQMMSMAGSQIGQFIQHKRVEESLRESEEKYRLLFSGVSDAIVIFDAQTQRIDEVNEAAAALYGMGREELCARSITDLFADRGTAQATLQESFWGRARRTALSVQKRKDGTVFPAEIAAGTLTLKKRLMGIAVVRDITQRKRAEEAERLRARERMQRDFVATVSHEFRTPVAAIRGFAEALLSGGLEDARNRAKFVRIIDKHAVRLGQLIEDILEICALDSGKRAVKPETVAVAPFVRKLGRSIQPLLERRGLKLRVAVPDGAKVLADNTQLSQVFHNLLSNAVKFSKPGGAINVSANASGSALHVSVRDAGSGIPPEDLPHIFEPFNRSRRDRARPGAGSGLGLSIVKRIVEDNGGRIWAESPPGRGATFHFSLPRVN